MQLINKNQKTIIILSISLIGIIPLLILFFFLKNHNYDQQGTNLRNFKEISTLKSTTSNNLFEQYFTSDNENLDKITFYYINNIKSNSIELSIIDNHNTIRNEKVFIEAYDGMQYYTWDFKNILNSTNKIYSLLILSNNNFELITIPVDRYPDGKLFSNGELIDDKIMVFNFDYYQNNLLPILMNRLIIYKPGIFQFTWTFGILFILILIFLSSLFYLILKNILGQNID